MSARSATELPITQEQIRARIPRALELLTSVMHTARREVADTRGEKKPQQGLVTAAPSPRPQSVGVIQIATDINRGDKILDENTNLALNALRTGLAIGLHLGYEYAKFCGLETLRERNAKGQLNNAEIVEFNNKNETMAAITDYVTASYVLWRLADAKPEGLAEIKIDFAGIPEPLALSGQITALSSMLFHFGSYLKGLQSGLEFLKMTQVYFRAVADEIKGRADSLRYADAFTDKTYRLERTSFRVEGFGWDPQVSGTVVEFRRVEMQQIVGNHEMKRKLLQQAQIVIAYDFTAKRNPFMDFEAMTWLGVLQGWAGTGKSMGLSFLQTLVHDYCEALVLPFQLRPIPNAIVSSLQGESAKQYEDWFRATLDPNYICVAPVDDSEAVFLDRRSQSSSEGSKLVVMSHLRLTEGSTAFNYGNVLHPHATNNADMIDAPVFSRYQYRVRVPGAETRNDFCDQMRIWGDGFNRKAESRIIDLRFPQDYTYLSDQGIIPKSEREAKGAALTRFKEENLVRLWEKVEQKRLEPTTYDLYGTFFSALHEHYEQFTSRDIRNITMNAASRLFGFDFPQEWLQKRDAFVAFDFDTKKKMILDAGLQFQGGLSVEQVLFQEMVHYVETTIEMLDSGRQYRIRQMANDQLERIEAQALADKMRQEQGALPAA